MKNIIRPLPEGTIIVYPDIEAFVVEDHSARKDDKMKNAIRPLPKGTIISYLDFEAVVVKDYGEKLCVITVDGNPEVWYWEYYDVECRVVSYPTDEK